MRVCPRHHSLIGKGSPRWQRTLHHRGLQKQELNSGTTGGARKKASIPPKMPLPRPPPCHRRHNRQAESRVPVSVASWNVHQICDELNLGHFHPHDHRTSTTIDELERLCPELQRLQVWELGCLLHACTRELDRHNKDVTKLSMYSNWRISGGPGESASAPRQGCQRPGSKIRRAATAEPLQFSAR